MNYCIENYCEKENNLFFEKSCYFFIHIFEKSLIANLGFNMKVRSFKLLCKLIIYK